MCGRAVGICVIDGEDDAKNQAAGNVIAVLQMEVWSSCNAAMIPERSSWFSYVSNVDMYITYSQGSLTKKTMSVVSSSENLELSTIKQLQGHPKASLKRGRSAHRPNRSSAFSPDYNIAVSGVSSSDNFRHERSQLNMEVGVRAQHDVHKAVARCSNKREVKRWGRANLVSYVQKIR
jgi:hypothetical protein